MKHFSTKVLCAAMFCAATIAQAKEITVQAGGTTLATAVSQAKSGDTIIINGTIASGTIKLTKDGITIRGNGNAVVDFTPTFDGTDKKQIAAAVEEAENGSHQKLIKRKDEASKQLNKVLSAGRGFEISGNNNTLEGFVITNAADNGMYITGSHNTFKNLELYHNHDTGAQISQGGSYNHFIGCYSHHNVDEWNGGENADGFACKLGAGEGNIYEDCIAAHNADDAWDLFGAAGSVTFIRCQANYSGLDESGKKIGYYSNGNGFKLGGLGGKTDYEISKTLHHTLTDCSATGNAKNGYDRNNQCGKVTMTNCSAEANQGGNFHWPKEGSPSSLVKDGVIQKGEKITYGTAYLNGCISKNGTNDLSGAKLDAACKGF